METDLKKPLLLVLSDSPSISTGFGTVAKNILAPLREVYEIAIFALGYSGDWVPEQSLYRLYQTGRSMYGYERISMLVKMLKPDLIFIINDPWIASEYTIRIREDHYTVPIIVYTPVDSVNLKHQFVNPLNQCQHIIAYTEFGKRELTKHALSVPVSIIPHGVDTSVFYPIDKQVARETIGMPTDKFYVMNVNRNQPRKRIDLYLYYCAEWLKKYPHDDVLIYYHGALKDSGIDVEQYTHYLGIDSIFATTHTDLSASIGIPLDQMKFIYNSADVFFTPCGSEGHGLTIHEAMACGIPCILPDYSALGEWPRGACYYVGLSNVPTLTVNGGNTIQRIADMESSIEALEDMYTDHKLREYLSVKAFERATEDRFNWTNIAAQFRVILQAYTKEKDNGTIG